MLNVTDEFLYGFTEGEGCFYVGIVPSKETKLGWQVIPFFKVSQNPKGKVILDYFKKRLKVGYVKLNDTKTSSDNSLAYVVRDFASLKRVVVPFFEGKLIIKAREFKKFKKILEMMQMKMHLNKRGLKEIISIAYSMNTTKRKVSKEALMQNIPNKILTDYTPKSR